MTVAASVLRALCSAGATTVFGLPGTHNMAFWAAPRGASIPRLVNVRHEQTAVYAADGWAEHPDASAPPLSPPDRERPIRSPLSAKRRCQGPQ